MKTWSPKIQRGKIFRGVHAGTSYSYNHTYSYIYIHMLKYGNLLPFVFTCASTHPHTHIWKLFSFQSRCGYLGIPGYSGIRLSSGVVIHRVTPTVLDLWYSIGSVNHFLMCYCAATLMLVRLMAHSSGVV